MPSPFPGMDPWLERGDVWPDVHNSLIAAMRDALSPLVRPRYFVALEERTYLEEAEDLVLVGRPDLALVDRRAGRDRGERRTAAATLDVRVPMPDAVRHTYLRVRRVEDGEAVTVIELLSPTNKRPGEGRRSYLAKRNAILASLTTLVEMDLLRAGEPMPLVGGRPVCDYAALISRAWERPRAQLLAFGVRDPLPPLPIPLREGESEPAIDLAQVFSGVYDRAAYDLQVDYARAAEPPLAEDDARWAAERLAAKGA